MISDACETFFSNFELRPFSPSDIDEVKTLHDQLFPVSYSDKFYSDLAIGLGPRNHSVHSLIAVQRDNNAKESIAGFLFAQFEEMRSCEDSDILFPHDEKPKQMMYILTLGVRREYRRSGLGSKLLDVCIEKAIRESECGGVFLHVISYNIPAIRFYERKDFVRVAELNDFYRIHGINYNAYLYAYYTNDYSPGFIVLIQEKIRKSTENVINILNSWMSKLLPNYGPAPVHAPYMDDIVLEKRLLGTCELDPPPV